MKKITVIGHFGFGLSCLDGQTVKTKVVADELCRQLGEDQIIKIDTHGGAKNLLKAPLQVHRALKNSKNVIIFPAHNGLRVYAPLLAAARRRFKDRRLHYVVIGGWLPEFLKARPSLAKSLKSFDGIYVETNTMKQALTAMGFENVAVMPNCKKLAVLSEDELVYAQESPYRLCTFSRVMKEKGIEDAVAAVKNANERLGYAAFELDIYGQVDEAQRVWFDALQKEFPDGVRYCGAVDADKSVETLKNYFALLFPTHFYTEGIPGTIIDAYAAGLPVIAAKWESFADIIEDDNTGIGYDFDNPSQLEDILMYMAKEPSKILKMKSACLKKAKDYTPETALRPLLKQIERD